MTSLSKKELEDSNRELRAKLKEMKLLEKKIEATSADLPSLGFGVHKDAKGKFHIVKLKYDLATSAAAIDTVTDLHTTTYASALLKAKEYLVYDILKGGKL